MRRLEQRVAIITGAGSGIGQGIAVEYARHGAVIAAIDLSSRGLEETKQKIEEIGGTIRLFSADITDYDRLRAIRDAVVAEFGQLDIQVNNAGISIAGNILTTTLPDWQKVIAVNLEAVYVGSQLAAEVMVPKRYGRIISIASIQAFMTTSNVGSYNAAKAGVVGLTHSMSAELAPYGILVNAIAPGAIRTGMSRQPDGSDAHDTPELQAKFIDSGRIPQGRFGTPEDVAGAALFLASEECRYMVGQTLVVDGGLSLTI